MTVGLNPSCKLDRMPAGFCDVIERLIDKRIKGVVERDIGHMDLRLQDSK